MEAEKSEEVKIDDAETKTQEAKPVALKLLRKAYLTLDGHDGDVAALAISPDGNTLISGSFDKTIRVWDLGVELDDEKDERTPSFVLEGHTGWVLAVALSSDTNIFASGSFDGIIKIWNLEEKTCVSTFTGHSEAIRSLVYFNEGKKLISASDDNTLKVWEFDEKNGGNCIQTLSGHSHSVHDVAVSADGKTAVSASLDKTIMCWNLDDGKCVRTLSEHQNYVFGVTFTSDSKTNTFYSNSNDPIIKVWSSGADASHRSIETGHKRGIMACVVNEEQNQLITCSLDRTVILTNLETGERLRTFVGHEEEVRTVILSPNGEQAISGSSDFRINVWKLTSSKTSEDVPEPREEIKTKKRKKKLRRAFEWDTEINGAQVEFITDYLIKKRDNNVDVSNIFGPDLVKVGVTKFSVKIYAFFDELWIGISNDKGTTSQVTGASIRRHPSIFAYNNLGPVEIAGKEEQKCSKYKNGDIVDVECNFDSQMITFFLNGNVQYMGKLPQSECYTPFVALDQANDQVEIIPC